MKQVFLTVLLVLAGCSQESVSVVATDLAAQVNGEPIRSAEVDYFFRGAHGQEVSAAQREQALERLIESEVIYQEAVRLGLDQHQDYQSKITALENQLIALRRNEMLARYFKEVVGTGIEISDVELEAYFQDHLNHFSQRVQVQVLGFEQRAEAEQQLRSYAQSAEEDRETVLNELFQNADDTGLVDWRRLPMEWHDTLFSLKVGDVSPVFEGDQTGIRLFRLIQRQEIEAPALSEIRSPLRNRLRDEANRKAYGQALAALMEKADITRF